MRAAGNSRKSKRLRVRPETQAGADLWAAIGSASPIPDDTELDTTWSDVHIESEAVARHGDPVMMDFEGVVPQRGARMAKEVGDLPSLLYRRGEATIATPMLSAPDDADPAYGSVLSTSFARLLASGMRVGAAPAARTLTAKLPVTDASFSLTPASAAAVKGVMLGRDLGGIRSIAAISNTAGADPQTVSLVSPFVDGTDIAEDEVLRVAHMFRTDGGDDLGPSVSLEFNGRGYKDGAYGCRWSKLELRIDERRVVAVFTMDLPIILSKDGDADVATFANVAGLPRDPYDSEVATFAATRPTISTTKSWSRDKPPALPLLLDGELLPIKSATITIENPLTPRGQWTGIGMGPTEPDDPTIDISLMLSRPLTSADRDLLRVGRDNYRELKLPLGPVGAHGGGIIVPGASLMTDPDKYDESEAKYLAPLQFQAGPNYFEGTGQLNSPILLGLF